MMLQNELALKPMDERMALMRDPAVNEARDALGGAALALGYHSLLELEQGSAHGPALEQKMAALPAQLEFERGMSMERVLRKLEMGFERITAQNLSTTPPGDELQQLATRTTRHAHQLKKVETLSEPKRLESVELGKEILRKLRSLEIGPVRQTAR